MRHCASSALGLGLFAILPTAALGQDGGSIGAIDIARIRELYHLTDTIGDRLWPGFDTRRIPIAVNHLDQQELLVGHPKPPEEFAWFTDIDGVTALLREGSTRYGPRGGGWAVDLAGVETAYVGTKRDGRPTEDWLSLLLHECFHVYQKDYRPRSEGAWNEPPEDDPVYGAMIGLESRVLHAALQSTEDAVTRELVEMFVAVRHARREGRSPGLLRYESEYEYSEGTATYVQARLMLALARELALVPAAEDDELYQAFADAEKRYQRFVDGVLPGEHAMITFFHAQYQNGMAQCLLLDRVRPGWKDEMKAKGITQFALLERAFPLDDDRQAELVSGARKRFDYEPLLAAQKDLVAAQVARVRGYLEAPGRRYRLFHGEMPGRFNWKPKGPVYHVPESLMPDVQHRATVWVGGIAAFEKTGLTFRSKKVPVIFRQDYLEWIDPDPAADESDLVVESERVENGVHHGLKLRTDGFTLEVDRARIERSPDIVKIHPLPTRSK